MNINTVLITWLKEHPEIEHAILFGSYAKGSATTQSDVDIAMQLSSGHAIQAEMKIEYLAQLSALLKKDVDLVDLRSVGQPLLSQIMKYGHCLVGTKSMFAQTAIRNINSTQDFMPNIEKMLIKRRERWLNNGEDYCG